MTLVLMYAKPSTPPRLVRGPFPLSNQFVTPIPRRVLRMEYDKGCLIKKVSPTKVMWSWRFCPTGKSCMWGISSSSKCFLGPMPDNMRSWGELKAPAERTTSFETYALYFRFCRTNSTPKAFFFLGSIRTRVTCADVRVNRFFLALIGSRKALSTLCRRPFCVFAWTVEKPMIWSVE